MELILEIISEIISEGFTALLNSNKVPKIVKLLIMSILIVPIIALLIFGVIISWRASSYIITIILWLFALGGVFLWVYGCARIVKGNYKKK